MFERSSSSERCRFRRPPSGAVRPNLRGFDPRRAPRTPRLRRRPGPVEPSPVAAPRWDRPIRSATRRGTARPWRDEKRPAESASTRRSGRPPTERCRSARWSRFDASTRGASWSCASPIAVRSRSEIASSISREGPPKISGSSATGSLAWSFDWFGANELRSRRTPVDRASPRQVLVRTCRDLLGVSPSSSAGGTVDFIRHATRLSASRSRPVTMRCHSSREKSLPVKR